MSRTFVAAFLVLLVVVIAGGTPAVFPEKEVFAHEVEASGAVSTSVPNGTFDFTPVGELTPRPVNSDFEDGLNDWTTSGTVQSEPSGIDGDYAELTGAASITSDPFTVSSLAQVLTIDLREAGSGSGFPEVVVLYDTGFTEQETLSLDYESFEDLGDDWYRQDYPIGGFAGQEIKLRVVSVVFSGSPEVHVDNAGISHQTVPGWHLDPSWMGGSEATTNVRLVDVEGNPARYLTLGHAYTDDFMFTFHQEHDAKKVATFRVVYRMDFTVCGGEGLMIGDPSRGYTRNVESLIGEEEYGLEIYLGDADEEDLMYSARGSEEPEGDEKPLGEWITDEFVVWNPDDEEGGEWIVSFFDVYARGPGCGVQLKELVRLDDPKLVREKPVSVEIADPVDVVSGNYTMSKTDLALPSLTGGLAFTRSYSAQGPETTPTQGLDWRMDPSGTLGNRWGHNWQARLHTFLEGEGVLILLPGGRTLNFLSDGVDFVPQPGLEATLIQELDDSWTLTFHGQVAYRFTVDGLLSLMVDRNGNETELTYDSEDRLEYIIDESGRWLRLHFANEWTDRIRAVSDSTGRHVHYAYDERGNLTTISDVLHGPIDGTLVEPGGMSGWAFAEEGSDGTGTLVEGPGIPPFGSGSARITTTATTGSEVAGTDEFAGLWLFDIATIEYSTYVAEASATTDEAMMLQFDIDYDLTDMDTSAQGRLVFEPNLSGTVEKGTWQRWSPLDGLWWSTDDPGETLCPVNDPCTWEDVLTNFPSAGIHETAGQVLFAAGPGWAAFDGNVDGFVMSTYWDEIHEVDFEAGPYTGDYVRYEYSETGALITQGTDAKGNVFVRNTYDSEGRIVQQLDAQDGVTTFEYATPEDGVTTVTNQRSKETLYFFDQLARVTDIVDHDDATTSSVYDGESNRTSSTNALNETWSYTYDSNGNVLTATDPLSEVWTYTYNANNDVLTITDPLTRVTEFEYDGNGNLIKVIDDLENETNFVVNGNGLVTEVEDALENATTFVYDAFGNRIEVTNALTKTWTFTYDEAGRVIEAEDPLSHSTHYEYDPANRLVLVTDELGNETSHTYDANGNVLTVTDAELNVTTYAYDDKDQLVSITDAESGVWEFGYDEVGNLIAKTNPREHTTDYVYDDIGRLLTETDPLSKVRSYEYDLAGRLVARTDPKMQEITYTYNDRNELTRIDYPDMSFVSFAYNDAGARTQMVDSTGTTTYAYDELHRLTSVTFPGSRTVGYDYDDASRRTSITYPGGSNEVTYGYDDANRLTSVTDWNSNVTQYAYDDANRMTTTTLPSGTNIVTAYTYDDADRLTDIEHVKNGSTTIASVSYTLDDVGNRTQRVDQQGTHTYAFDDLYRLTSVTYPGPSTTTYAFDAFGNREEMTTSAGTTTYTYDDADRITEVQPPSPAAAIPYDWDDNGNLLERGADEFVWDYEDRMVEALVNSVTTTFAYRGDGLRNSRTVGMTTTTFTWDINSGLPVVLDDGSQYVYGAGLSSMKHGGNWYYYLADGLGSTMAIVDASGDVENGYTYDVYGQPTVTGSLGNEFDFAGQQTDPSTGLQYLRARYYDPVSGTFMSRDPLASIPKWLSSHNGFASANPARFVDPSGLRVCDVEECDAHPAPVPRGKPSCGPWGCRGQSSPPEAAGGTPVPGQSAEANPSACTLTPPYHCHISSETTPGLDAFLEFAWSLTGEYRSVALALADVFPIAEACAVALSSATGPVAILGIPSCAALDYYIGGLAFMDTANAIDDSQCGSNTKTALHVVNTANLVGEWNTFVEAAMFGIQTVTQARC